MTYEHQERYRRRTILKARYFDQANEDRIRRLRWEAKKLADAPPEVRACVPYFLSHPEAVYIPHMCEHDEGGMWSSSTDRDDTRGDPDTHAALAYVALTSSSSWPVEVALYGDGWSGVMGDDHPEVLRVRKDIEELRACGMWVIE